MASLGCSGNGSIAVMINNSHGSLDHLAADGMLVGKHAPESVREIGALEFFLSQAGIGHGQSMGEREFNCNGEGWNLFFSIHVENVGILYSLFCNYQFKPFRNFFEPIRKKTASVNWISVITETRHYSMNNYMSLAGNDIR